MEESVRASSVQQFFICKLRTKFEHVRLDQRSKVSCRKRQTGRRGYWLDHLRRGSIVGKWPWRTDSYLDRRSWLFDLP